MKNPQNCFKVNLFRRQIEARQQGAVIFQKLNRARLHRAHRGLRHQLAVGAHNLPADVSEFLHIHSVLRALEDATQHHKHALVRGQAAAQGVHQYGEFVLVDHRGPFLAEELHPVSNVAFAMCVHGGVEERFVNSRQQGKVSVLNGIFSDIKHLHQRTQQVRLEHEISVARGRSDATRCSICGLAVGEIPNCLRRLVWKATVEVKQLTRQVAGDCARQTKHRQWGPVGDFLIHVWGHHGTVRCVRVGVAVGPRQSGVQLLFENLQRDEGSYFGGVVCGVRHDVFVHTGEARVVRQAIDPGIHRAK
mmetsp:Transcript_16273/g.28586  ORF Transcript_16273/g.28586 Transcript_16273/m.28586 type:complete len:305 (-) Transcript_16273:3561-4475(-)